MAGLLVSLLACNVAFSAALPPPPQPSSNTCLSSTSSDLDFTVCQFCTTDRFLFVAQESNRSSASALCAREAASPSDLIAAALVLYGQVFSGIYWDDDSAATKSISHLVRYMPRRDSALLFSPSDRFLHFVFEHVRYALLSRSRPFTQAIPDAIFLDYVLPYAFVNENRDVEFRWRPRFAQLFSALVSNCTNLTDAMHRIAEAVPSAAAAGVLQVSTNCNLLQLIAWRHIAAWCNPVAS